MGAVPFLQIHYRVPHMAVQKVNPDVGMCCRPPLSALHQEPYGPSRYREGDPIYPGVWRLLGGLPLGAPTCPILSLAVCRHQHLHQLHHALQTVYLFPSPHPKLWSYPRYNPRVCCHLMPVRHVTWLAYHNHQFLNSSGDQHCLIDPSIHPVIPEGGLATERQGSRHWRRRMTLSFEAPVKNFPVPNTILHPERPSD